MKEKILGIVIVVALIFVMVVLLGSDTKEENDTKKSNTEKEIIELGKDVYDAAKDTVENADLDTMAKGSFNGLFEVYEGRQTGVNVRSLIASIITNNKNGSRKVALEFEGETLSAEQELNSAKSRINNTKTYNISIEYSETGYVEKIIVK